MMHTLPRRRLPQLCAAPHGLGARGLPAWAQGRDATTLPLPTDVPPWDPNARVRLAVQSLYNCFCDSPLTQAPDLAAQPNLVKGWGWRDKLTLALELRDDAVFHNGDKVTAEDFRYTFLERPRAPIAEGGRKLDTSFLWRKLGDIEIVAPNQVIMRFTEVMPTAVTWLYFLASFVVPKNHHEKVGLDAFADRPVGSGPYRLVEYQ